MAFDAEFEIGQLRKAVSRLESRVLATEQKTQKVDEAAGERLAAVEGQAQEIDEILGRALRILRLKFPQL